MLAIGFLLLAILLGDALCRRSMHFLSIQHRLAVAFLTGVLISSCFTYLAALAFSFTSLPLVFGNITFLLAGGLALWYFHSKPYTGDEPGDGALKYAWLKVSEFTASKNEKKDELVLPNVTCDAEDRPEGRAMWDIAVLAICLAFSLWLVFVNLTYGDGAYQFSVKSWSDFGPHLSLAQSFAMGNNFPTEHPFFPGEIIRYHFLFWFLSANLSYLGLNLIWAVNLLSLLSLMAVLVLISTLAELLFGVRSVGRIASVLFFFASSSLSYIPFLRSQSSLSGAVNAILTPKDYLKSGYPYWGDNWGALSVAVYTNQRHLITAVGLFLMVLVYVVQIYRWANVMPTLNAVFKVTDPLEEPREARRPTVAAVVLCGVVIGLLPYLNSAIFVSALIVLGSLLVLFRERRKLAAILGVALLIGLPQVYLLRAGQLSPTGQDLFQMGYTINEPTIRLVLEYLGWTFGFKWILLAVAIALVPWGHRKLLLAFCGLVPVVFLFRLSTDAFNNHKLLNVWTVLVSVYVAYALLQIGRKSVVRAALSAVLALVMVFGAIVDLVPLYHDTFIKVPAENDRLTEWLLTNTSPGEIFLSDRLLSHPILFTGRRPFLGNTYFLWTAGYRVTDREAIYKRMFQDRNPVTLLQSLRANRIGFIAIDDAVRKNGYVTNLNEETIKQNFEMVFEDTERRYDNLVIYRVPPA